MKRLQKGYSETKIQVLFYTVFSENECIQMAWKSEIHKKQILYSLIEKTWTTGALFIALMQKLNQKLKMENKKIACVDNCRQQLSPSKH